MLLVRDLAGPDEDPEAAAADNNSPMELFSTCGVHGGLWRCPYTFDSLGSASYVFGVLSTGLTVGTCLEQQ
jgi:hypothetical protein